MVYRLINTSEVLAYHRGHLHYFKWHNVIQMLIIVLSCSAMISIDALILIACAKYATEVQRNSECGAMLPPIRTNMVVVYARYSTWL